MTSPQHTIAPAPVVAAPAAAVQAMPAMEQQPESREVLSGLFIQCKLSIGAADDPLEQEADTVADRIMRMPVTAIPAFSQSLSLQRKCTACAEAEEGIHRKALGSFLQAKADGDAGVVSDDIAGRIEETRGGGAAMDGGTRSFMEQRFGADFSAVNIHTDATAETLNRELDARAFAVGNDIYFNSGQYNPATESGKHLLAHELTHTLQQQGNAVSTKRLQRKPDKTDEDKIYAAIDYPAALQQNNAQWQTKGRFYSVFEEITYKKGTGLYPWSAPVAYANHVYEIQTKLRELWKDKYLGNVNGIVDDRLLTDLQTIAEHYASKKKDAAAAYGIDTLILERFIRIKRNMTRNRPLTSALSSFELFNTANENYLFGIARGESGEHIAYLKAVFFDMNYLVRDDLNDSFDQKTYDTVRQFQHDTGLNIDGIVGPSTLQLLDAFLMRRTTAFITPGSEFKSWGRLSDAITIYTDGDGDQKKELKLTFTRKGAAVIMYAYHTDTKETRGPLRFTFEGLDLDKPMWIYEYVRSNRLVATTIRLVNSGEKPNADGTPATEHLITIQPPIGEGAGAYRFNDQEAMFNVNKFDPLGDFATGEQVNVTNPTYVIDVGPYNDTIKLFFKSSRGSGTLTPDAANGRLYSAELFLIGTGKENIIFGGAPMKVKLKSTNLVITNVRHDLSIITFDLDGDGVEDITLNYRITQAQKEQRPDFNRYIELFFNGPALDTQVAYQFEKIGEYFVGRDKKSEELFKQMVPALGNEHLEQQEIPESRQQDIAILNNLLSQIYIKALDEKLIEGDTYLAWKKLEISLQYLKLFVAGKKDLSADDREKITKTARFATEYQEKIRRDTAGKESHGGYGIAVGPGAASSTSYQSNPYSGDSESTTSTGFYTRTNTTTVNLSSEILLQQWDRAAKSYDTLNAGFNLWVADRLKDKHTDNPELAAQTRGAYFFIKGVQEMLANSNAIHLTRLKAVYYSYEKYKQEDGIPAIELPLYYYYNTASRKWWLVDFINPSAPYWTHIEVGENETPGDTPPAALFQKLNDKDHLPKGMLLYTSPDKKVTGQVELTEPWEWKDVLAWFGAVVGIAALVGAMIFSGGAATPVSIAIIQAMFAASAIAGGISAGIDLYEHYKNEDLTPMTAMLDIGNIAASVVGLSMLSSGRIIYMASRAAIADTPWVGAWAKLASAADQAYVPLAGLNIGINGFNIVVLTSDTLTKLDEIEKTATDQASKDRAKILLLSQLAFAGGMTILSLKGDMASLTKGANIVLYPGKNGVPVAAVAESIKGLPIEQLNMRADDEFDMVRSIREKMFGKAAMTETAKLKGNKAFMDEYQKLNKEIYELLNNPKLDVATKKQMLAEKIAAYDKLVAGQSVLDKTILDTSTVKEMAAALDEGNFGVRMTLRAGKVNLQGAELGSFPELLNRVKTTNAAMRANGSENEVAIILMPSVTGDGTQEIMLLSRKRWVIPSGAKPGASLNALGTASTTHQQYIIDVGAGTNSFAVDMIPAADRKGSIILNTEYAPKFMDPAMLSSELTWKNAAAKTDVDTVVVIGDPLTNMHEITGDKSVRQVFINNVNAGYNEQQYQHLAEQLVASMDEGGRVKLQWTDDPEIDPVTKLEKPRGHIEGVPLEKALLEAAKKAGRQVTVERGLAVVDYNYGITPSTKAAVPPDRPLTPAERKGVTDPIPRFHWDFIFN